MDFPAPNLRYNMEERFLLGPQSRLRELRFLFKVMRQFIYGFRRLHFLGPCITVFGSARFTEGHSYYELGRQIGAMISQLGFAVMTGGGPGIMEAVNRGAKEAGGISIGCNIRLPAEQAPNAYLDRWITLDHFFVRKVLLLKYSYAFVVLPGGFGTLDELFETLTLIQTRKIYNFPILLMGTDYWNPLLHFLDRLDEAGTISREDLALLKVTDDLETARQHLQRHAVEAWRFTHRRKPQPVQWLGEHS